MLGFQLVCREICSLFIDSDLIGYLQTVRHLLFFTRSIYMSRLSVITDRKHGTKALRLVLLTYVYGNFSNRR